MAKILIIEDDQRLRGTIKDWLESENYAVETVGDGSTAFEMLLSSVFDLLIVDWNLPGMSGLELCKKFRIKGGKTPVLMLTAKSDLASKECGLDGGADDYLTKPFHMRELSARIKALLRRPSVYVSGLLQVRDITVDPQNHVVRKCGVQVDLTPKEFAIIEFFLRHPNQLFSPEALIVRLWPSSADVTELAVRTCMKNLRRKLYPDIIENVHGVGYRLVQD